LNPMMEKNIDTLVLGCTHYPYLIPSIRKIITNDIKIIDAGFAVARQTKNILKKFNIAQIEEKSKTTHKFFSNKDTKVLSKLLYNYSVEILSKEF
jgi:glutamate racemase